MHKPLLQRRVALTGMLFGMAALMSSRIASLGEVLAFAGAPTARQFSDVFPLQQEMPLIMRRATSQFYSNLDRERLAKQRQERREALRARVGDKISHKPIDMDKLPSVEDIYARKYTGDGDTDPIGGRKRYTYWILFKNADTTNGPSKLKPILLEYMLYLKKKLSAKDIKVYPRKSPIDNDIRVQLEYEMKEYGEIPREQKRKNKYSSGTLVEFQFKAPVEAPELFGKKIYSDINVLRFMVMCQTRSFKHAGEDNELLL